jgi:LPPG:FO 2-phospho-L-lactate transferase
MTLAAAARQRSGDAPLDLSVIVNTGDDLELHGLHISPDIDTVMYTLSGWANSETGWGVRDETWSNAEMLARYGAPTWFRLGDRDLATHLRRTERLRGGATLTAVTGELAAALGVGARLLPMTDDLVRTRLRTDAGWLDFQAYFVERHHEDTVHEIRIDGLAEAAATGEVSEALDAADAIVIAPSNPFVSVGPILGVPGVVGAVERAKARGVRVVAVSPIVGGAALRGPADRMFRSLGGDPSAAGVARHYVERYPGLVDMLVIDARDTAEAEAISASGVTPVVAETVMRDDGDRRRLAEVVLAAG